MLMVVGGLNNDVLVWDFDYNDEWSELVFCIVMLDLKWGKVI